MVIDAADDAGVYIPRFCYHKKLSVAANCRMCLVEIEKVGKPMPACATPATAGMKVFTQSEKAISAQRAVMEFLLINHPLDCPICDQGGECELQDLSIGYGDDIGRYTEGKRAIADEDLGPLISTEMTRCIYCTRCVRFGTEIAGIREMGMTGRGENSRIGTYVKHFVQSEVSGNIIDLCPVGALTNKPYRFTARAWEMKQHRSVAAHDCLGSNIYVHTRGYEYSDYREVMRIVPCENESINETWISDRDRYSYEGLKTDLRLPGPMLKKDGKWLQVDWSTALNFTTNRLQEIVAAKGGDQIAALAAPSSTLEELYLLQKILRELGSNNIDHRLRQNDFSQQEKFGLAPGMNCSIADLDHMGAIFLVGADLRREQPIANLRVRKASLNGGMVMRLGVINHDVNFDLAEDMLTSVDQLVEELTTVANGKIAAQLKQAENAVIIVGALALQHPQASEIIALSKSLAETTGAKLAIMTDGANSAGAWLAGAVPHRQAAGEAVAQSGLDAQAMMKQPRAAYLLMNVEPEHDVAAPAETLRALAAADLVVCFTPYMSEHQADYAHVLLPIAPFTETDGTFVNVEQRWQSFKAASLPFGEVRPGWKVLRVLANLLELPGYDFTCSSQIRDEVKQLVEHAQPLQSSVSPTSNKTQASSSALTAILTWPMYCHDVITRRAAALQATLSDQQKSLRVNSRTAEANGVVAGERIVAQHGHAKIAMRIDIDDAVPDNSVLIPMGLRETAGFGAAFAEITLQRGDANV
ncbi:MAG: NADH-quinone oxidoreductase subunit NuoG [Pseudomonadota bacterium]|nr:NADH-quinone oxidoreductase subunit NuoG [Pseudomonadota bacterium]